jgi:hypothetical protein
MPEESITNTEQPIGDITQEIPLPQAQNPITQSPTPSVDTIVDIKQKEIEIKKKKRRFKFFLVLLIILIVLAIATPIAISYYKKNFIKNKPNVQKIEEEDKKIKIEDIQTEKKIQHNSDTLYISLEYLDKAKLTQTTEGDNQIKKLEIAYEKQPSTEPDVNVTEDNLKEGYIFKASIFAITQRELDEIVQVKKDSFIAKCPQTAVLSDAVSTTIDGVEGRTFDVTNCGADYKLTYVVKGVLNYEFAQIVKGDIGYKQVYKAETEDILNSIKFYPDKTDEGPLETYRNEVYGFQFKHPKFNLECCDLAKPVSQDSEKIIVLGDTNNFVDKSNFDGIGIFIEDTYGEETVSAYIETQKKTLVDDYIVVKGVAPKLEEKALKVGNKDGVMLKGYSWRGEDYVYVNISPDPSRKSMLIISIKNTSGREFEKKVDEILKSFEFFTPTQ